MGSNQFEIKIFNNLYTQTRYFDKNGVKIDDQRRASYYTGFFQFLYGINKRINVGFDVYLKSVYIGDMESSPLKVMKFGNNSMAKTALTGAGPKIKVLPFKQVPELSVQSIFIIPNTQDLQNPRVEQPFLEYNSFVWWTQVFYDYAVDDWLNFFLEADALARFSRDDKEEGTFIQSPFSFFASFYPTRKFTVYGMFQLAPTYGDNFTSSFYTQAGGGMKYQLFKGFEIELLYTSFILGENSGAGQTYNIGFRYLR